MHVKTEELLFPVPAALVAEHSYAPLSEVWKFRMVKEGSEIVPPEYFAALFRGQISFLLSLVGVKYHVMSCAEGCPLKVHDIV